MCATASALGKTGKQSMAASTGTRLFQHEKIRENNLRIVGQRTDQSSSEDRAMADRSQQCKTVAWQLAWIVLTFQKLQVVGDFLQDDEAGQDQADWAPQPRIGPLAAIGPVPLAILQHTDPSQTTPPACQRLHPA